MGRVYFVIDMKSFFASVECSLLGLNPLTTKLVVADKERGETTICLAVSPALKALGVKNRCRLNEIPKDLDYIIACPQMQKYIEYAGKIYSIYLDYISKDEIHVYSIDECFLDVTSYLKNHNIRAKAFATLLINRIKEELNIPATVGIGSNLYLAKIALDIDAKKSKEGIGWLDEDKFIKQLSNHRPITDFWRISRGTSTRLQKYGIYDMEGIRNIDEDILYNEFGIDAELMIDHAYGKEPCLMKHIKEYKGKSKSISSSQILFKPYSISDALIVTKEMVQAGCLDLAKAKVVASSVLISYVYNDMTSTFARINLTKKTNLFNQMIDEIIDGCKKVFNNKKMVRRIGYSFYNLLDEANESYDLFTDMDKVEKEKNLRDSILVIQEKYGKNALLKGIDFLENATQRERNEMIGGHRGAKRKTKDATNK